MKKIYLYSLLFALFAGGGTAYAEDYDYEWAKVTDLSEVNTGDLVLLVDESKSIALPNNSVYFTGVSVRIENGKIADNDFSAIKWTLTKEDNSFVFERADGQKLCGVLGSNPKFEVGATGEYTTSFSFDDYGENGGEMRYLFSNYLKWESVAEGYRAVVKTSGDNITLFKHSIKNYVKWKRSDYFEQNLGNNDVIVVLDQATERALANDKADNDPDAVAVTLNDDKDRIAMEEVPEKLQWIFNRNRDLGAWLTTNEGKHLYADTDKDGNPVLRVGEVNGDNIYFSYASGYPYDETLYVLKDEDIYEFSVDESMFSNIWQLSKHENGNPDNDLVYYKKVEDPQKYVKIKLAEYNFELIDTDHNIRDFKDRVTITGAEKSDIKWSSSNTNVATVDTNTGVVTLKKRGSTVITASVSENEYHDKASAKCTLVIDGNTTEPGTTMNPLTVGQAKELTEEGEVTVNGKKVEYEEGVYYYIKGKVSKVNSGMMAMFGDMDFGEMMGNMGGNGNGMNLEEEMDDMDFDMEDIEESGFDMSSFANMGFDMSAFFGSSDKVTYYISDDGTKDNQLKVLNGNGEIKDNHSNGVNEYKKMPDLSPGDWVVVRGPLIKSKDENMLSGLMGNNEEEETWKVGEENYLNLFDPTLLITQPEQKEIYVNKTLDGAACYDIDDEYEDYDLSGNDLVVDISKFPDGVEIKPATFKSSDEEIAKWDEETNKIVGVNEGKAKITVKVKVIVVKDNPDTEENEEKSYTMKRKFKLIVKTRDLLPAGYYDGDYVLTTNTDDLLDGTRLILVGTRVKDGKETDYYMGQNNSMMGGGKNGNKIEIKGDKTKIPCEDAPNALEVVLEKVQGESNMWYLNAGQDENGTPLYLYASDSSEVEEEGEEGGGQGGFDMKKMMEMFTSGSGLKVATKTEATSSEGVDSCLATITFNNDIATIKFINVVGENKEGNTVDKNNTIMLSSAFDLEEMMNMFGNMGNEQDEGDDDEDDEEESSFDMSSFDMFMAAFNTKKPGEENAEEGKEPKCFMPRIYRFVPDESFDIKIGSTEWRTIVTYKDVDVPENVEAYIVTKVTPEETRSMASLKLVQQLKGGEPYLLHYTSPADSYTMTLLTPYEPDELEAPKDNKLLKSDRKTTGTKNNSDVYVLADMSNGVGFYRWTGDELGAGRVYLSWNPDSDPDSDVPAALREFISFGDDTPTDISSTPIDEQEKTVSYYNLSGQRVDKPLMKGVYITNGKKILVK